MSCQVTSCQVTSCEVLLSHEVDPQPPHLLLPGLAPATFDMALECPQCHKVPRPSSLAHLWHELRPFRQTQSFARNAGGASGLCHYGPASRSRQALDLIAKQVQDCFFRGCARKTRGVVLKQSLLEAARRLEMRGARNAWPSRGSPICKPCRSKLSKEAVDICI